MWFKSSKASNPLQNACIGNGMFWSKLKYINIFLLIISLNYLVNGDNVQSQTDLPDEPQYSGFTEHIKSKIQRRSNSGCLIMDGLCIFSNDVASYEAIKALHAHLDDDQSGDIDLTESVDFLREELNYTKGLEKRQKAFHYNNDQHISVQELWNIWLENEVHNWTVEQTVAWLHVCVELGQYAEVFYENAINGSLLPRLATNSDQFLYRILGIKNPTHRSKISIKAMDIVLFGPPKETGSLVKDVFIASLILVILILVYKFKTMSSTNNEVLKKMDQEMEALQEELMKFHKERKIQEENNKNNTPLKVETMDKESSEERDAETHSSEIGPWDDGSEYPDWDASTVSDIPDLDMRAKNELQLWLQLTYEKERLGLEDKMQNVKLQLSDARDMCDKLKPNRKNLFGALSFIHGKMESRQPILEARAAFAEIQAIDKEMEYRWNSMERLLGFAITQNGGIEHLRCILEPPLQVSMAQSSNTAVVQQLLRSQSALMFLTMGGYPGLASASLGAGDPPISPPSRRSALGEKRRSKMSLMRGTASVASDGSLESNPASPIFSIGSTRSHRGNTYSNFVKHSHTVESGLSNYSVEEIPVRSASSERRVRKLSNGIPYNGSKTSSNGYSTDDTDSGNYTIGENSAIKIDSGSIASQSSTPPHSPSTPPSDKRQKEGALRSFSDKSINKFSSEPSLETEEGDAEITTDPELSKSKRGILGRSKFFKKFKSKTDKTK